MRCSHYAVERGLRAFPPSAPGAPASRATSDTGRQWDPSEARNCPVPELGHPVTCDHEKSTRLSGPLFSGPWHRLDGVISVGIRFCQFHRVTKLSLFTASSLAHNSLLFTVYNLWGVEKRYRIEPHFEIGHYHFSVPIWQAEELWLSNVFYCHSDFSSFSLMLPQFVFQLGTFIDFFFVACHD